MSKDDLYYAGDMAPRLTFGFKLGLEWKGIDFSAFFQGVGKQVLLRGGYLAAPWTTNYVLQNKNFGMQNILLLHVTRILISGIIIIKMSVFRIIGMSV